MKPSELIGCGNKGRHGGPALPAGLALLLSGAMLVAGCAKGDDVATPGGKAGLAKAPPPAPVTVAIALKQDVPVQVQAIGAVEAYSTVTIKSRVPGQLVKVTFQQGQDVKKGDVLFEIDRRPYEAALALAKANLARDVAQARNAREEAQFQQDIYKRNAGTQRETDRAIATAEAAEAQVKADQAAVENAEIQVQYCRITSPLDGRTGDLMVHEGSIVKNDDTAMVVVNQVQPINVTFSVAEKYLPLVRQYMTGGSKPLAVEAAIPQTDLPAETGELAFVDNQIDRTTGMIGLKAVFANEHRRFWPGQFANVALTLTTRTGVIVVPSQAVQTGQAGQFVFVVKPDGSVESRPVTPGDIWKGLTVIQKGDLQAGETIVTDGQLRLKNGTKVAVKKAPGSQPAAEAVASS